MSPERWAQLESLIDAALDLSVEERGAYLARLTSENRTLGDEVREFVAECERSNTGRDVTAVALFPQLFEEDAAEDVMAQLASSLGAGYVLERELDGGGMSRVFVAYEPALGRRIVVKTLAPELAAGLNGERFEREIALAASLQQANIVPVLAAGRSGNAPYYTMPFIEGRSLRERLAREGALPIRDVVNVLRDVTRALSYAHERGVVHRDIKPGNILLSGGAAVVTDFGIAKALGDARADGGGAAAAITQRGVVLGTPAYMSPEQLAADPEVDRRADLYALGAVAYEMLTGNPPFTGRSPQELVAAHLTEPPKPVDGDRPAIPAALATLVMQCLAKRATDRPQSADDVLAALETAERSVGSGVVGGEHRASTKEAAGWFRRRSPPRGRCDRRVRAEPTQRRSIEPGTRRDRSVRESYRRQHARCSRLLDRRGSVGRSGPTRFCDPRVVTGDDGRA